MGFNYAFERAKFDVEWQKKYEWYKAEGMSDDAIRKIYEYDLGVFNAERSYVNHTQELPDENTPLEYGHGTLVQKYEHFCVTFSEADFSGRYAWVETIEDEKLVHKLKKLNEHQLEMLTLISFEGYTQEEAAKCMEIPYRTFKYQLKKLRNFLK